MNEKRDYIELTTKVPELNVAIVLDRLIRDVSVPIERVERVLEVVKQERYEHAHAAYGVAMATAQQQMTAISRDMVNTQTRSKYASLAQVDAAIRPIYTELGLSITFDTEEAQKENWIIVVAEVSLGIYKRQFRLPLPADGVGAKGAPVMTKTHAMIAAITYARRALLKMVFNLAETDDDGVGAERMREETLTLEQITTLGDMIVASGRNVEEFCKYAHLENLADLAQSRYEAACNYVRGLEKKE